MHSNLLKQIEQVQSGLTSGTRFQHRVKSQLIQNIQLNTLENLEKVHTGASINSVDLEAIENRYLLSGNGTSSIAIHDLYNVSGTPEVTYKCVQKVERRRNASQYSIETVQWYSLDTGMFTTSGTDKKLKVWDTNVMKVVDEYEFSGIIYNHAMSKIAIANSLVAVGNQSAKLRLIDLRSGSATHTLRGHQESVLSVEWSNKDEHVLASGGADRHAMLWDVRSSKGCLFDLSRNVKCKKADVSAHIGSVNSLLFTQDGRHLLTFGADEYLRLWDTSTGRKHDMESDIHYNKCQRHIKMAISPFGGRPEYAFVPARNNIHIVDVMTGEHCGVLRGHYNQVNCCVFNENTMTLYSAGSDRNILIWTCTPEMFHIYDKHMNDVTSSRGGVYDDAPSSLYQDEWSDDD